MSKIPEVAVAIKDIHKDFILPHSKNSTFKQTIVNIVKKNKVVTNKVLDGVSFEVNKGDFFGIVGRNGSGKSTLLKLIAGVYTPTAGSIQLNGKLTPFIELGVGFNPELSGRDNVYLNGALLGFDRKQMSKMYDEIVAFAELEPFMDQKLKNYSSGMQVRLAFAIAIMAKNEILIFDEVLAVGDEAFQRKCLDVFDKYKADGQTIILVTHDMGTVKRFCNRAVLINDGKIVEIGNPLSVASKYSQLNQITIDKETESKNEKKPVTRYLKVKILDEKMNDRQSFMPGEKVVFDISWKGLSSNLVESVGANIYKQSGEHITGVNSRSSSHLNNWKDKGKIAIEFKLDIAPGAYFALVEIFRKEGVVEDAVIDGPKFIVKRAAIDWAGLTSLENKWIEG